MTLIGRKAFERMVAHARASWPAECCGFLTGRGNATSGIREATNAAESGSRFFIAPAELFDFFRTLRTSGLEFTGVYHSHPQTPATPSERDAREFHYRDVNYWIVSLEGREPEVRCYHWRGAGFEEVGYRVTRG
jgi:proteasome lid subunit RPN8/RPN11